MIFYFYSMGYTLTKEVMTMNVSHVEMGGRIFALRKERGLTRERLAEMADISVQFLADLEKGRKSMTVTTLSKLASALLVTTDTIVTGKKDAPSDVEKELWDLCMSLPPEKQTQAAKLLRAFFEITANGQ